MDKQYSHYFKKVPYDYIDVYRVLELFEVSDPCIQHAVKKLLVAGGRGAKSQSKDVKEAIVSLNRWIEMREEEDRNSPPEVSFDNMNASWADKTDYQFNGNYYVKTVCDDNSTLT
jgi:hypothetical protein